MNRRHNVTLAILISGLAAPSTPPALAETLVTGRITDPAGQPVAGTVSVHAWPRDTDTSMPIVGRGVADTTGSFTADVTDPARLRELAAVNDGWMDFIAIGDSGSATGQWAFTSRIDAARGTLRSVRPSDTALTAATSASHRRAPRIRITAKPPRASSFLPRWEGITGDCNRRDPRRKPAESTSAWAIVGEMNNAYNDGTVARFTYGEENQTDTSFGVAYSDDNGQSFSIGGETHIADAGSVAFPTARKRYARKLRTKFEFTREQIQVTRCSAWETYIRVTSWMGGADDRLKQSGALDKCEARHVAPWPSNSKYNRASEKATRWNVGVEAFGVYLTTQSGFSRNVRLRHTFGGPTGKDHYLCGADGKSSPMESGRVFSGSRK